MKLRTLTATAIFLLINGAVTLGQAPVSRPRIPWKLTVVVMDGTSLASKADIPVKEAVRFIEARTRLKFEIQYVVDPIRHTYTPYYSGRDRNRDGRGDDVRFVMMGWDVPVSLIESLPVSTSYLFLYKLNRRPPAQAGSAVALENGIIKGGKHRPYATIATDQPWFTNQPNLGFRSWAAQVVAHELINTIQAKVEAAPYHCGQLTGRIGLIGDKYEAHRLRSLTEQCYAKLGSNED